MKRIGYMWVAAAVVFAVSIGAAAAQSKAGEAAAQPKTILFLHSYGLNVQPWAAWSREIQAELNRQSPWPLVPSPRLALATPQRPNLLSTSRRSMRNDHPI